MAGSLPSWWRPVTRSRLSASRPVRLFGDEEQYLSDEDDDGPDEDPDFQWWDGPEELEYEIEFESNSEPMAPPAGSGLGVVGAVAGTSSSLDHDQGDVSMGDGELNHGEVACPTCGRTYDSRTPSQAASTNSASPGMAPRTLVDSVARVVDVIAEESLTVGRFLTALCWGDPGCVVNSKLKNVRSAFMRCPELPKLLLTWWKPPRSPNSHKSRPQGARNVMEAFAKRVVEDLAHEELGQIDPLLRASGDDLSKDDLTKLSLDNLETDMRTRAPTLWTLLENLCKTPTQVKVKAITSKRVLTIMSMLAYTRSHFCNRMQRLLGIYFKFKGVTAKGCDTLHALGISMSAKWITNSVEAISSEAMKEVQQLIHTHASFLSYDNVYMTFRIFSQRIEKNGTQTAGTAATVYVKKDAPLLDATINRNLQHSRRAGMQDTITSLDIVELAEKSAPDIHRMKVHHVLQVLIESPEFDLSTYAHKTSPVLRPPAPVDELPCGPEHVTLQFMLGTLPTPEATYEDNDKVIAELLEQLGCRSISDFRKLSLEHILFVIGDQLTVERIRGLQFLLCQEWNSHERLDFTVPVFGWLHFVMAFAKSLHKQYFGTNAGMGLKHAFTLLGRKGLDKRVTQGPFHDNLDRAFYHILEAHLRTCWLQVSGASSLKDLRGQSPEDLKALAEKLVLEHASTDAMTTLKHNSGAGERDDLRLQTTMFLRDVLLYVVLDRAIKYGDVGLMEGILPHTLLRFAGGQNSNYTIECLELLQGLHKEWPPEVCEFVRKHCWLVNTTGRRDGHTPVDRVQEARIKDIKVCSNMP
uniref:Type 1 capsular polysaccharide biosynthesis protein J (CapJ) n=1 Tax=Ganoderma boninense TaxID=34458 RepID=A0A5K1K177_9APHY|nr:Type 1 capsular polysaccharide biosynthesis protein J (CapJ) [Ganoderma boninense]